MRKKPNKGEVVSALIVAIPAVYSEYHSYVKHIETVERKNATIEAEQDICQIDKENLYKEFTKLTQRFTEQMDRNEMLEAKIRELEEELLWQD